MNWTFCRPELPAGGQPQSPPLMLQAQVQPPQMQPPQQAQMQQAQMQAHGYAPGARVIVQGQDGNRYPATVVQLQNGQYLCAMANGQSYWFAVQHVVQA